MVGGLIMMKWNRYIMKERDDVKVFWSSYYKSPSNRKVLFFMGKGFDPRMNNNIQLLTNSVGDLDLKCVLVDFHFGSTPKYKSLVDENVDKLSALAKSKNFEISTLDADFSKQQEHGIRTLCHKIHSFNLDSVTDVVVDISSLPRNIYFNILRTLYNQIKNSEKNLFVVVSENVEIDKDITEENYNEASPIWGFKSKIGRSRVLERVNVSIPIVGEGKVEKIRRINSAFPPDELYVILPFPSRNPRRSEDILIEYSSCFNDELELKEHNILYAHEQNPFELYRLLHQLIDNYNKSLDPLKVEICFGVSILSSKLLSIGALLVALEHHNDVAIFNVSGDYIINDDIDHLQKLNTNSESFLIWIDGEAYRE